MSTIWQYQQETQSAALLKKAFVNQVCPCCTKSSKLSLTDHNSEVAPEQYTDVKVVRICHECGWWIITHDRWERECGTSQETIHRTLATGAALSILEPALTPEQLATLCSEVEQHLKGKGQSDNWKALEDATTAVLKNFGLDVTPTGARGDGGMDAVVRTAAIPVGVVQVKHSKNKIGASVMRELVGATTLSRGRHALLVASSNFTAGAMDVQRIAGDVGLSIELVNGEEVLRALRLTRRTTIPRLRDLMGVAPPKIPIIDEPVQIEPT